MNEVFKQLLKAPWSSQKVGLFIRALACIFVILATFAICAFIYFSIVEGVPRNYLIQFILGLLLMVYMLLLFGRVALKGRAPEGWLPWK
jgi:hypothetical protein